MSSLLLFLFNPIVLLAVLGLAIWQLRRTRADPSRLAGSGRMWRRVALVVLGLQVAGLGICGGVGLGFGLTMTAPGDKGYAVLFLGAGALGLLLAALLGWVMWHYRQRP